MSLEDPTPQPPSPPAAQPAQPPTRWRRRSRILWREWVKPLLIIGFVMFSFRSAVADWNDVPTGSMKPTILEGDRIFINKLAYDLKFPFTRWRLAQWSDPQWGDVVVLLSPEDGKRLVKRVVGLPGDVIELRPFDLKGSIVGLLYRNGVPAEYTNLDPEVVEQLLPEDGDVYFFNEDVAGRKHPIMMSIDGGPRFAGPFRVPEGEYFVMGDNRNNSRDSRYFGSVDRSLILGQATAVALSLDLNHSYKPRWGRFFSDLP